MQLRKDYADLVAKTSSRLPDVFIDLNYLFYFILFMMIVELMAHAVKLHGDQSMV